MINLIVQCVGDKCKFANIFFNNSPCYISNPLSFLKSIREKKLNLNFRNRNYNFLFVHALLYITNDALIVNHVQIKFYVDWNLYSTYECKFNIILLI